MLNGNLKRERERENRNTLHNMKELERKKEARVVENSENQMGGASTVYVLGVNWWEGGGSKCWPVDRERGGGRRGTIPFCCALHFKRRTSKSQSWL